MLIIDFFFREDGKYVSRITDTESPRDEDLRHYCDRHPKNNVIYVSPGRIVIGEAVKLALAKVEEVRKERVTPLSYEIKWEVKKLTRRYPTTGVDRKNDYIKHSDYCPKIYKTPKRNKPL